MGGLVAVGVSKFFNNNNSKELAQQLSQNVNSNIRLVSNPLSSSAIAGGADFVKASEKSVNAVVHIKTTSEQVSNLHYDPFAELFFGPQKRQENYTQQASGSGVIVSNNGYIVTNNHVVNGADKIEVVMNDKRSYEAKIVGTDPSTDVALLKIDEKDLPYLTFGNSEDLKIGEWVLAVGNPFNLESTVTAGIISAKGRSNIIDNSKRPIESFLQTDAVVNPGNSGGALVNLQGDLIGINTAIMSNNGAYQGYSFAVPVNIVKKIVSDLIEYGTVQRAYIGVSIRDIDAKFAKQKNIQMLNGVYVSDAYDNGSAKEAGIEMGDIITKIENVSVTSVSALQEQISKYRPGDKIKVSYLRNNREANTTLILKSLDNTTKLVKKSEAIKSTINALGAEFSSVEKEELNRLRIMNGVKIEKLNKGILAQVGIKEGFIITAIDKKKIENPKDIENAMLNKKGVVSIQGFYPNGLGITYQFSM